MGTINETGHAKVLSNFDRLIKSVTGIGVDYSPSNPSLAVEAMQKSSSSARDAMDAVGTEVLNYRTAVKQRETAFDPIGKLSTRILNTLKVSDKNGKSGEIATLYVRKIQGRRAKGKRTEEEKKADIEAGIQYNEVSSSQMSFDLKVENFAMLVKLVCGTPSYLPNEKDLQPETLKGLTADLQKKNELVRSASSDLFKARARRNDLLYKEATGLIDIALDAKTYLKGAFGPGSSQYKEVAGLYFKRINRN